MKYLSHFIWSSIGKKYIMSFTGACLGLFLIAHVAGNSFIFWGRNAFNAYAEHLHSVGKLIYLFEAGLLTLFVLHIFFAANLYFSNLKARPLAYAQKRDNGGSTLASKTMPYTGIITLIFILVHLDNFHFTDGLNPISDVVRNCLKNPALALYYIFSLAALTLHISHGFWSFFQSAGINHPKYDQLLWSGSRIVSFVIGAIFILFPILALINKNFLM